jgi:hypothetical protein
MGEQVTDSIVDTIQHKYYNGYATSRKVAGAIPDVIGFFN